METLVPGWMPRAGLLLLPLLLCFRPETVESTKPAALREIVDHVDKDGLAVEYAFAVSLEKATCENPSGLEQVLPRKKLRDLQVAINQEGGLQDPDKGNIVAARMKNSHVQKLLVRTYNERSCLIFFTIHSPCAGTCQLGKRPHNILQMVSDTFRPIDHNYKAFVFRQIYRQDQDLGPKSLLGAWHRLPDLPLLRCDTKGCRDCRGNDPKTDTNACLDEMRAMRQPLHPPGRGQEREQGGEGRAEDVEESRGHLQRAGEMVGQGAPLEGSVDGRAEGAAVTLGGRPDIALRQKNWKRWCGGQQWQQGKWCDGWQKGKWGSRRRWSVGETVRQGAPLEGSVDGRAESAAVTLGGRPDIALHQKHWRWGGSGQQGQQGKWWGGGQQGQHGKWWGGRQRWGRWGRHG
ncbi:uncharacterized protein LOC119847443 isoform X2 [Dermochelys coriacea]|uniref:uncharacterized protein LOC119847443 isoform X2 n=1 Tax=Dermochelys coriacea TaxID=27794 RepID=UPI001CA7DE12|nr:uncharacterized protein LOC119847443 isoform X2 [Dermochelys coriacea]